MKLFWNVGYDNCKSVFSVITNYDTCVQSHGVCVSCAVCSLSNIRWLLSETPSTYQLQPRDGTTTSALYIKLRNPQSLFILPHEDHYPSSAQLSPGVRLPTEFTLSFLCWALSPALLHYGKLQWNKPLMSSKEMASPSDPATDASSWPYLAACGSDFWKGFTFFVHHMGTKHA